MNTNPLFKTFKTLFGNFVYDANNNEIIKVDSPALEIISLINHLSMEQITTLLLSKFSIDKIKSASKEILEMRDQGFFSSHHPRISSSISTTADVASLLERNLRQLILELTEDCNLSCHYCSVAGYYTHHQGSNKHYMSLETAIRAVNFFIENYNPDFEMDNPPAITFYGGEPLLHESLLQEIIGYVHRKYPSIPFRFSFTTNGTLLDDKILDFIINNNVSLLISLDGPPALHDRHRIFSNGKGSFESLFTNLTRIQKYYPVFYREHVSFNAVLSPPYKFDKVFDFFHNHELFMEHQHRIRISPVSTFETSFLKDFCEGEENNEYGELFQQQLQIYAKDLIDNKEVHPITASMFDEIFFQITTRRIEPLGNIFPVLGSCIPGQRRLFVNSKGLFFMCERVGSCYAIGDIVNGFDYQRILEFLLQYDDFFKDCRTCWALRICKKCFAEVKNGEKLDSLRKAKFCTVFKERLEKIMVSFCMIVEKNPGVLERFKNYKIL